MRFDQLRYLDAAVRTGSMRRAAAETGVSQPTVTQQIQRLEEELDVVLLVRRPSGVAPTDAGLALLPHVRQALQAENGLHQEASALSGLHRGRLRLGTIPMASQLFVPRTVKRFREAYPRVAFEVTEAGSGGVRDGLMSGVLELGVLARWKSAPPASGLRVHDLLEGQVRICVPVGHRLQGRQSVVTADLAGEAFVVVERGQLLREVFERIAATVEVTAIYQTNASESARRIVDAGVGISVQGGFGAEQADPSTSLLLDEPWAQVAIAVAQRRDEMPTPAMKVFLALVREEASQSVLTV